MQLRRIAFIGLGRMGLGMAGRLLDAGYEVTVYNRNASKAELLVSRGAKVAASPRTAADGAKAVIAMVADDAASRAVWLGDEGALAVVTPEAFVIECSTLSHGWVKELAGAAVARGIRYIDCPVTGLPDMAARGTLTLLAGADEQDLKSAEPYLTPLSERIIHFGPIGCGTVYKLMINLMGAVQIAAAAEGMALAERAGLDLRTVADAIALGQAASPQVVRNTVRMANDDHEQNALFTPPLRLKDAEYAVRLAHDLGLSVPFGDTACEVFRALCELGYDDANESKVIEVARRNRL
ncbi:MAG: NAD(P)-dependent oxidoreductase [Hyphomicrobiales bacterium]|nr:NAD(P)-dependent oxidoreductase [Hyphomicrobiales bacterium]